MAAISIGCSVPTCDFRTPEVPSYFYNIIIIMIITPEVPSHFYPNMVDQLKLHQWSRHSEGQVGKIVWSVPGAPMDLKVKMDLNLVQPKSSESLQPGISPTPTKGGEDVVAHLGDSEIARMAEGQRLKKQRRIEAEKEEGRRVVVGRKTIQDSVQGRDGERPVVGGGGQSKPGETMEYSCPNYSKMLPSMQTLTNHFKNCYVPSEKEAGMAGGVGEEEEKIEGVVGGEEKVLFPCQPCGKIFFSMVGLNIHKSKYCKEEEKMEVGMVESHDSDPEWEMAKSKKRRPRGKLMKCPEKGCKAQLKSRSSLKEHIKFVHGERRIPCPAQPCTQRFSRSSHIADHMRAMHGAPKLQCNECEREFNGRSHLGRHMRTVHSV